MSTPDPTPVSDHAPSLGELIGRLRGSAVRMSYGIRPSRVSRSQSDADLFAEAADALASAEDRISQLEGERDAANAAGVDAFVTVKSGGNPNPALRAASIDFRFIGGDALTKAWRLQDALAAILSARALSSPEGK